MPLLLETIIVLIVAYLIGVGIGCMLFGRNKREGFY